MTTAYGTTNCTIPPRGGGFAGIGTVVLDDGAVAKVRNTFDIPIDINKRVSLWWTPMDIWQVIVVEL